jgi:hypothetical protein
MDQRAAHADHGGAREQQLERVPAGAYPARPDDRHIGKRFGYLPHAPHRHRPDGRPGQPAVGASQRRAHRAGIDGHAEQHVDERKPVRAGRDASTGHGHYVGHIRRQLGEHRYVVSEAAADRRHHGSGGPRIEGERPPGIFRVRAGEVDLDGRHTRRVSQPGCQHCVLADGLTCDGNHDPRPARQQPWQVTLQERVDARALQAHRVQQPAWCLGQPGRGIAGPRLRHDRLADDRPDPGDVDELGQLTSCARATRRGEHRVGQVHLPKPDSHVNRHGSAAPGGRPPV